MALSLGIKEAIGKRKDYGETKGMSWLNRATYAASANGSHIGM